jgi:hypothetical protein
MKTKITFMALAATAVVSVASFSAQAEEGVIGKIMNKGKDAAASAIEPASGGSFNFGGGSVDAKAGECYGQVTTAAVKKTETKKLQISAERKSIEKIIPATYKTVTEEVVIKEASESFKTIPATYKTVTEEIVVKPASKKVVKVPAKFEEKKVRVMVKPAHTVWKKGTSGGITKVGADGGVMCLVEVPAEYKVMTKRELVTPETTKEEVIPAVTKKITRKVVDEPARVEKVAVPAQTKTVEKRVLVKPEEVIYKTHPAEYKTVEQQVVVAPSKTEWKKILCQTNATPDNVKALQNALRKEGFDVGTIDGVLGYNTYKAVDSFQKSKGLSRGEITYDTLQALGLSI